MIGTASEDNHSYVRRLGAEPTTYGDALKITSSDFEPLVALAASGDFVAEIAQVFAFEDLPAAHELSERGHLCGKIVLTGP